MNNHFNLEVHQMDVKIVFLNGDLKEEAYMQQPKSYLRKGYEYLVCSWKSVFKGWSEHQDNEMEIWLGDNIFWFYQECGRPKYLPQDLWE